MDRRLPRAEVDVNSHSLEKTNDKQGMTRMKIIGPRILGNETVVVVSHFRCVDVDEPHRPRSFLVTVLAQAGQLQQRQLWLALLRLRIQWTQALEDAELASFRR